MFLLLSVLTTAVDDSIPWNEFPAQTQEDINTSDNTSSLTKMYYDYDDDDDDLQRILEGRDVEDEPVEKPQPSAAKKEKRKPQYEGHGDEEILREDDDLDDFIERDDEYGDDGRIEAGDNREDAGDYDADEDGKRRTGDDEAVEAPSSKPKVRRVVMNPQPKLDADRLKSEKGLIHLVKEHEKLKGKLKGKGHEVEDLDKIMFTLEHWGHRLFPKLNFDDFLERCEQLGHKKAVSVFVKKMRLGLPLGISAEFVDEEEDDVQRGFDGDAIDPTPAVSAEQAYDQLFGKKTTDDDDFFGEEELEFREPVKSSEPVSLTEEQKEMIARKRLEALERREKRLQQERLQQQQQDQGSMETNASQASQEVRADLLTTEEMMDMF